MQTEYDVIIVGGGLAGLTLAGLLGHQGLECVVIEAGEKIDRVDSVPDDPRALAITHASRNILASFHAWQCLPQDRLACFRGMQVWDENGSGAIAFDSTELGRPTLGYIVEQAVLQTSLEQAVRSLSGISVLHNSRPCDIQWQDDHVSVILDKGENISAHLLVAADGVQSACRAMAGINYRVHDYRQRAVVCVTRTALPHGEIARQRFLTDGPLAFLPMYPDHQCGIVWSTRPAHAEALLKMTEREFNQALQAAFEHTLGEVKESERRSCFPLRRAEAEYYCRERFALIGDAAHSVHPLAGQGANLGLLDAASLAQLILEAGVKGRDIGGRRVLRSYERWRKGENRIVMMTMEGFKYVFENQSSPVPMLRNRALNFANSFIPLKHTIMRYAMGLSGDLPVAAK